MTVSTDPLRTNGERLPIVRLLGYITPPAAPGALLDPDGYGRFLPGQGSVAMNAAVGDDALSWASDHLEPGASLALPDATANRALQIFSCVGNGAAVAGGPARGARGVVIGKHGVTLVAFAPAVLAHLAPGDPIAVESCGVGLEIDGMPDIHLHSTSPAFLQTFAWHDGDRLAVRVAAELPPSSGAAGMGFEASWANLDLETHDLQATATAVLKRLRFGDLVLLQGHDHRYVRAHDPAFVALGLIAHGASVSGGHGLGLTTLLSAPRERIVAHHDPAANLATLLDLEHRLQ